jgi:hypothetical protein
MHAKRKVIVDPLCRAHISSTHSASPPTDPAQRAAEALEYRYRPILPQQLDERYRPPEPTSTATEFRHGHWAAARERVRRAMVDADFGVARRYSFQACGGNPLVQVDPETNMVRVKARCCHDRWCRACGRVRRQRLARALAGLVGSRKTLHVVLTLKSADEPLGSSLTRLIASFAKLRRSQFWSDAVAGGAWVFEVTHDAATGLWHPHLHTLVHSTWLDLKELSAAWHIATGDSHRVHVSLVHKSAAAIAELTKYVGKITHRSWEHDEKLLAHAMRELNGRRLCSTFGSWQKVELQPVDNNIEAKQWITWGSIDQLFRLCAVKDPDALALKTALLSGAPLVLDAVRSLPPPATDPTRDCGPDPPKLDLAFTVGA